LALNLVLAHALELQLIARGGTVDREGQT
jgi:hypothetical protein